MASKKRSSGVSSDEIEKNPVDVPAKKKLKNDKRKTGEISESGDANSAAETPPGVASSAKDMEKRKKRKALDKERKRAALENDEGALKPKTVAVDRSVASSSSSTGGLSELPLNYFRDLVSADASVRKTAAESLVLRLQEIQKQYEMLPDKDSVNGGLMLEAEKNDGLDDCAPHLRYTLRRLIRGVSSSRECARQGFALGLTLPIGVISSIKVESLLKLILDSLAVSSSMKGQDVKECLLGRLFAYGAVVRSGRLNKEWQSDKDTPVIKEFTNAIFSLATVKRYLQEPAVHVLLDMVDKLPAEALLNHVMEAPELHKWFEQATEVGNPDALLLALKLQERISVDHPVFGKLLPAPFSSVKLFSPDHLSAIANCLKESTFCQPRVHSLWPVIIDLLLPETVRNEDSTSVSNASKKTKRTRKSSPFEEETTKNIQNFCEVIIEGTLLSSSHDRKHLAFDILLLLLPSLPASFVPSVLSYKFVQCLMDILSTKDSWLHKVAQHFLKELLDWVRKDDARRVAVTMALQKHSDGKFDTITRTKTIKDLTAEFETEDGCSLFIQNLMNLFVDEQHAPEEPSKLKWALEPCSLNSDQSQTTDDNSEIGSNEDKDSVVMTGNSDLLKSWVIESLPGILKHAKLAPDAKCRVQKQILKFLAVQGLFRASLGTEVTSFELEEKFKWPKTATPTAICKISIEQLQLLLSNSQKSEDSLPKENGLEPVDLCSYFMKFLCTLQNIPSVSLFRSLNEADEKAIRELQETESKLSREERNCGLSADANKLFAMRHLIVQLLLQVLLHPEEFSEAANELAICCDKAFSLSPDLPTSADKGEADDESPEVIDVLVDTLLSLLPQSSAPLRSAIEKVFKYFCHDITNDGLLRMLRVIKKDLKPARHQDSESEDLDDDDEDCLAIEEEEEENEDIDEAETGETGESDEQTDDSETVIGIQNADKELAENSDDSESDEGMDDDAMFRMDTYLAQIFKEKRNQAGGETAQSQLVLFKLRVLSLLEIYLHENPGHSQVLTVYSNLARALVNPSTAESSEQLVQRIWGIVQKRILKAKDFPKDESIPLSTVVTLLEKNLKLAAKPFKRKKSAANPSKKKQSAAWNRYKMISSLAQNSTYWILKIIDARKFSESDQQMILDIFQSVLVGYFDSKKSHIKIEFLEEVFRRRPWIGHRLFGFLLEKCVNTSMEFRRIEALDLITETMRSLAPVKSRDEQISQEVSSKTMKTHLQKLSELIKVLVSKMPEKQTRRSQVRKSCHRIFQMVSKLKLTKSFLKKLGPDGQSACESSISDLFLELKNTDE